MPWAISQLRRRSKPPVTIRVLNSTTPQMVIQSTDQIPVRPPWTQDWMPSVNGMPQTNQPIKNVMMELISAATQTDRRIHTSRISNIASGTSATKAVAQMAPIGLII